MALGKIFFISGPSGAGKGTLINALRSRHKDWVFPPSCTTREPRPGEKEGETYYFISKEEFQKRIEGGEFLEYAVVHGGNYYGTLKQRLLEPLEQGKIVIREFDVQGYEHARHLLPRESFESIFLVPQGGLEVLIERIKRRAPIGDEELHQRMESMKKELALANIYDHQVYSREGEIEAMIEEVEGIILH